MGVIPILVFPYVTITYSLHLVYESSVCKHYVTTEKKFGQTKRIGKKDKPTVIYFNLQTFIYTYVVCLYTYYIHDK